MIEYFRIELTNEPGFPASQRRAFTVEYIVDGEKRRFHSPALPPHPHWESEVDHLFRHAQETIRTIEQRRAYGES